MKPNKFRAKRLDNKEWVYGYYVQDPQGRHRIYYQPFPECSSNTYHFVDPDTLGQFTGLPNKNIWEGDVGVDKFGRDVKVVWVDEYACFALEIIDDIVKGEYNFTPLDLVEVIGNIHDKKVTPL